MDSETNQAVAERLKERRTSAGLTQKDVAGQITGKVTRQLVSAWERGETLPTLLQLIQLCMLYGTSADHLLFGVRPQREYSHPLLQRIFRAVPAADPPTMRRRKPRSITRPAA